MLKKDFVNQEGFKDCGPACLSMIIKHYNGYIELEDLKSMCKTDKNGTSAYYLIEAAKEIGLEAYGIKIKMDEFKKENIILPCVAHLTINSSFNHYVVVSKINYKNKTITIKDPMEKIKKISFKNFESMYNNILLFFYPQQPLPKENVKTIKQFILKVMNSSKKQLLEVIIISLIVTILSITSSFYLQIIINNVDTEIKKIIVISFCFAIIYLFKNISEYFRNKLLIIVNQKTSLELTNETFKNIILLPYSYYRHNTTGEIISKINDLDIVKDVISKVALSIFIDLPLSIITLIAIYFINSTLFFISLIMFIMYIIVFMLFKNVLTSNIKKCQQKKSNTISYMVESITGFESVKGTNMINKVIENFEYKYIDLLKSVYKFDSIYNFEVLLKELINSLGYIIVITISAIQIYHNNFTIGGLISFNMLLNYFLYPIKNIIELDYSFNQAKSAIRRVLNLFLKENNNYIVDKKMMNDIEIKNLSFSYKEKDILKDINLKIKKGSKVMVIGSSGSGKSTLFKILKKYHVVKRNMVIINGIDINDYKISDIVYVSQNEFLFTDTVLNNIGSLSKSVKLCLVDEIVKNNQLGYNMLIEENGFNISGGEKQRIILARALNNNFNILIIDEGLSQMDINMERKIIKNLFEEYKKKTIIIISHRYNNMDLFDQVIKIEQGKASNVEKNNS